MNTIISIAGSASEAIIISRDDPIPPKLVPISIPASARANRALPSKAVMAIRSPDQLNITVEDNQLIVAGRREGEPKPVEGERAYLHRGIAARGFIRSFVLADGMEVEGAVLEHGLLHIDLLQKEPAKLVKRIPIRSAG